MEGAKKTVEGVLADVKAIKGIFQWFLGLFTSKPKSEPKPAEANPVEKKKAVAAVEIGRAHV